MKNVNKLIIMSLLLSSCTNGFNLKLFSGNDQDEISNHLTPTSPIIQPVNYTNYIENKNDGTGTKIQNLTVYINDSVDLYLVKKDSSSDAFNSLLAPTSWVLGGSLGSLVSLNSGSKAVFTASAVGAGTITAVLDGVSYQYSLNVIASPTSLVISSTKLTSNASFSYVEMEVDWTRKLAYLASRKANICVEVVDFSNEAAPVIVKTIGVAAFDQCLGVKLFDNNTKLVVGSNGDSKVAVWDLTSNPTNYGAWVEVAQIVVGTNAKRIAAVKPEGAGIYSIYLNNRFGATHLSFNSNTSILTSANTWIGTCEYNEGAFLNNQFVAYAYCFPTPLEILSSSMSFVTNTADIGVNAWGWAAAANADTMHGMFGGADQLVFTDSTSGTLSVVKKFQTHGSVNRDLDIIASGNATLAYAAYADRTLEVFDMTDVNNPILLTSNDFSGSMESEFYAVKANASLRRVLMVTNKGDFVIANTGALTSASAQLTVVP